MNLFMLVKAMLKCFGYSEPSSGFYGGEKLLFQKRWMFFNKKKREKRKYIYISIYIYIYIRRFITLLLLLLFSKILTIFLSSLNPLYLLEIQHIFNITSCANHVIVFFSKKRTLIGRLWVFLSIYTFSSSDFLIKSSIDVPARIWWRFNKTERIWWRFNKTETF